MDMIKGTYKPEDGKNYFEIALNLKNGQKLLIKNASCRAQAVEIALIYWREDYSLYQEGIIKVFNIGSDEDGDVYNKIPKEYKKYF